MVCSIVSSCVNGIGVELVNVEVDISNGIPGFEMSGALASETKEAKERVKIAIKNTGVELRPMKITVNISPANIRKQGTGFDLPIAVGILCSMGIIRADAEKMKEFMIIGELSLNGKINRINGVLPALCAARDKGIKYCIIPRDNAGEARLIEGIKTYTIDTLEMAIKVLNDEYSVEADKEEFKNAKVPRIKKDFSELKGQDTAKRAAMIAVAGMHNIMLIGSPGCGKTMIADRIPDIMPQMTYEEQLEVSKIYSVAGLIDEFGGWIDERQVRCPHHTITTSAMVGGGTFPRPGEITLAHKGVLFLDELSEYNMKILEHLRQPLEEKRVLLSRVYGKYIFPADFMMVAAMNPCKCGFYPDKDKCHCTANDINRYMGKISQPLWDRFDLIVRMQGVSADEAFENGDKSWYNTKNMREKVAVAKEIQRLRFKDKGIDSNSMMDNKQVKQYCGLKREAEHLIKEAYNKMSLTMRGYYKILRIARTIADLEECENIDVVHLSEAVYYHNSGRRDVE